jgi:hypothetical protein
MWTDSEGHVQTLTLGTQPAACYRTYHHNLYQASWPVHDRHNLTAPEPTHADGPSPGLTIDTHRSRVSQSHPHAQRHEN